MHLIGMSIKCRAWSCLGAFKDRKCDMTLDMNSDTKNDKI